MTRTAAPPHELLSPRAFGLSIGVSRQAVMEAIEHGRLARSASKSGGRWFVDSALGRVEWERKTDPSKRPEVKPAGRPAKRDATGSLFQGDEHTRALERERTSHAAASRDVKLLDAELKRVELARLRGDLVDRRDVDRAAFDLARLVRDRLLAIPERLAAALAAASEPRKAQELLAAELLAALAALENPTEALAS